MIHREVKLSCTLVLCFQPPTRMQCHKETFLSLDCEPCGARCSCLDSFWHMSTAVLGVAVSTACGTLNCHDLFVSMFH